MKRDDLISDEMVAANRALHDAPEGFGGSGWRHAENVITYAEKIGAKTVLDYGCGERKLKKRMGKLGCALPVACYDPGLPKFAKLPDPADLVVCTDVLEHVERDKLAAVMLHIAQLSRLGAYLAIATRPANKYLPDGRNAHLIVEPSHWWTAWIEANNLFVVQRIEDIRKGDGSGHEVRYWLKSRGKSND